jgi:hypothetical protein
MSEECKEPQLESRITEPGSEAGIGLKWACEVATRQDTQR